MSEKRSEPTTGEIVEILRENGDVYFGETEITCDQIADRIESQRQTIDELEDECGKSKMTIELLTDRARQLEEFSQRCVQLTAESDRETLLLKSEVAEEKALREQAEANMPWVRIDGWNYFCQVKIFDPKANQITVNDKKHGWHTVGYEKIREWRGLPQDEA